jgi:cytochrome c oxidase assembly protein subunit 11
VADHRRLRITFNGSVSDVMPWKFTSQQREVRVLPGETALAFYTATNKSDEDIIGVATYSVTPAQVAPYFSKIQCFCFEEQRLNAGETVDMPVFFFIDPDFVNDPTMNKIDTITLSYTFFSTFIPAGLHLMWYTDSVLQKHATTRTGTSTHTQQLDCQKTSTLNLKGSDWRDG